MGPVLGSANAQTSWHETTGSRHRHWSEIKYIAMNDSCTLYMIYSITYKTWRTVLYTQLRTPIKESETSQLPVNIGQRVFNVL